MQLKIRKRPNGKYYVEDVSPKGMGCGPFENLALARKVKRVILEVSRTTYPPKQSQGGDSCSI